MFLTSELAGSRHFDKFSWSQITCRLVELYTKFWLWNLPGCLYIYCRHRRILEHTLEFGGFWRLLYDGSHSSNATGRYHHLLDAYLVFGCCHTWRIRNSATVLFSILGQYIIFYFGNFLDTELSWFFDPLEHNRTFSINNVCFERFTAFDKQKVTSLMLFIRGVYRHFSGAR